VSQARFQKMQREKARREKAAAKRERKAARAEEAAASSEEGATAASDENEQERVLAELAALHDSFDAGDLEFDDYEDRKRELLDRLEV
jgi:hypothetical protein